MKKISNCFFQTLDYADIFRFPLTLSLNQKPKTSTYLGKLITLGILIFIFYSFLVSDMLNKKNPETLNQDLITSKRPFFSFIKNNFTMAIGVADINNVFYIDDSIFTLNLIVYHRNNTDQTFNQSTFKLKPCSQEDFKENPEDFYKLALNGTFCFPDEIINLGGYWDEEIIDYFYIELRMCVNSTEADSTGIVCQSQDIINSIIKYSYIDIYMSDHYVDSSRYSDPLARNLKVYYQQLDPKLLKTMNIYLKNTEIFTDDGFIFESTKLIRSFRDGDIQYDTTLQEDDNVIYYFTVYSSGVETKVIRKYQKVQTLLAELGGICNFLVLFGFLASKLENHYHLITLMSNELYIFPKITSLKKGSSAQKIEKDLFKNSVSKKGTRKILKNPLDSHPRPNRSPTEVEFSQTNQFLTQNSEKPLYKNQISLTDRPQTDFDPSFENRKKLIIPQKIPSFPVINMAESKRLPQKMIEESGPLPSFHESERSDPEVNNNQKISFGSKLFDSFSPKKLKDRIMSSLKKIQSESALKLKRAYSENMLIGNLDFYQKMKKKENFFGIGFWGFLKLHLKNKKWNLKNREKLFLKSEEQVMRELDILQILKKLQEIEKLKRVLLNDDQLYFFNLLSKPMIILENEERRISRHVDHGNKDSRFKFSAIQRNFLPKEQLMSLYHGLHKKGETSEVDRRIMALLDDDVMSFLKNDQIKE